jgi:hypothetical protein
MTWTKWSVLIHLGTSNPESFLGTVKARTKQEAEDKASKLAKSRGLSGLIEVEREV